MPIELSEQEQLSLEQGERIEAAEQEQATDTYVKAREASESELVFAGKFRTAEDLEKGYLELQKKLGSRDSEEEADEEPSEQGTAQDTEQDTEQEPEQEEPEQEEEAEPNLTPEQAEAILEKVGGQQVYDEALVWAAENLSVDDQADFNEVVQGGSPAAVKFAVEALVTRYKSEADYQGKQLRGRQSTNDGAKPFRSREEVNMAMQDPRYDRDPAYRNDVADRLAASADDLL